MPLKLIELFGYAPEDKTAAAQSPTPFHRPLLAPTEREGRDSKSRDNAAAGGCIKAIDLAGKKTFALWL
jgi:hypothetical protein